MSQYKYSLLTPRPETIRMLRLLPSEDNTAQIQCQLVNYTLPTPENLYAALLYLRERQLERLLWIDAICINQGDEDEKAQQIQFMPMIYGQASQVIVWLGETADQSDKALETIRLAVDDEPSEDKPTDIQQEMNHTAIVRLLERPWFRRLWVLQEVHAAQDILVICGDVKIHGYTFSSGLKDLSLSLKARPDLQSLVGSIVYLIMGAIFRPGTTSSRGTPSLGELIDMYHSRAATKKHDKSTVFQQVITYIFSEKSSMRIWPHRDLALIQSRGHIVGQVIEVKSDESQHDRHIVRSRNIALQQVVTRRGDNRRTLYGRNMQGTIWTLHVSANPIQKGDIVCLLEGASKQSIIRPYKGYLSLIVASATPLQEEEDVRWDEIFETLRSSHDPIRDISLIWDWVTSHTNSGKLQELEIPMDSNDTAPGILGMGSEETKRFDDLTLIVRDTLVKMDMGFAATRLLNYLQESKLPLSEIFDLAAAISRAWGYSAMKELGIDIIDRINKSDPANHIEYVNEFLALMNLIANTVSRWLGRNSADWLVHIMLVVNGIAVVGVVLREARRSTSDPGVGRIDNDQTGVGEKEGLVGTGAE
ncbi:heterokaryon incompatibility protein-domain-containing protein [Aspergillus minisclerotigenes]|uniref:Heterokaryon incompatibility protein-domain-containing protein n=1 Tax=Aspergillus minisclerotigenes TaxID=656917 RepID=A0A5N6JI87_9EURO|nr:heterokaryon incompatibility protein-domain-containing protein [Aspergillus minisclerotigenes]